ncbi:MAG: rhodanese-like domain-containing protein, partial [Bacteroidota bacterium]
MLSFLKKLIGNEKTEQMLLQAISRNALIVDVRTENEFNGGHIPGSKNIPLNQIVG